MQEGLIREPGGGGGGGEAGHRKIDSKPNFPKLAARC
jgi:hypothetical protein